MAKGIKILVSSSFEDREQVSFQLGHVRILLVNPREQVVNKVPVSPIGVFDLSQPSERVQVEALTEDQIVCTTFLTVSISIPLAVVQIVSSGKNQSKVLFETFASGHGN